MIFTVGIIAVRADEMLLYLVGGWEERTVPIIQCDIRRGRTEAQLRQLASGLTRVVAEAIGQPIDSIFLVMREMPGLSLWPTVSEMMLMLSRRKSEATRVRTPGLS